MRISCSALRAAHSPLSIPYLLITHISSLHLPGATAPPLLCGQTGFAFRASLSLGILAFKVQNIPCGSAAWQSLFEQRDFLLAGSSFVGKKAWNISLLEANRNVCSFLDKVAPEFGGICFASMFLHLQILFLCLAVTLNSFITLGLNQPV